MPRESWQMSRGLRAVTAAYGLIYLGLVYVVMRFFFPRVLLLPVTVIASVLYVAACVARLQVVLDQVGGEVQIIVGWWTRHVPLTQIEQVKVVRSGVQIRIAGGTGYGIGPLWKRRWLRSASVSSMRKMKRPPLWRAQRKQKNAVRALPRCKEPVGLGAKRVVSGKPLNEDISGLYLFEVESED